MIVLIFTGFAIISTWLLCYLLINPSSALYVVDDPNYRSLHVEPKPRTGGLAIIVTIIASWLIIAFFHNIPKHNYSILIGLLLLSTISYLDDRYSISQIWRLLSHIFAAMLLIFSGLGLSTIDLFEYSYTEYTFFYQLITILTIVWLVNLYNFMDGMDGLAAGMSVIGFCCFAILGWSADNFLFMLTALVVAAANFGFLLHNFPPAKIFMGDVGSISIGFLLAAFSLWGIKENIFNWWLPILIFSPFIIDATLTLLRRMVTGKKVWKAHKTHYYQQLVEMGWGHRKTAIYEYILMLGAAITAITIKSIEGSSLVLGLLLIWTLIYVFIIFLISYKKLKI